MASVHAGGLGASAARDERNQGAMLGVRRTFFLNTTGEFFWGWLEKYVCTIPDHHYRYMIPDLHFPTENGRIIHLHRSHRPGCRTDVPYWSLCGIAAQPSETLEEAEARSRSTGDNWLGSLISFDAVQLAPQRLEVTAECNHPAVMGYFDELLEEIKKRWPEARATSAIAANAPEEEKPERQKSTNGSPRPYMKERRKKVRNLSMEGVTIAGIASRLGCSEATVKRDLKWLREEGQL